MDLLRVPSGPPPTEAAADRGAGRRHGVEARDRTSEDDLERRGAWTSRRRLLGGREDDEQHELLLDGEEMVWLLGGDEQDVAG
jgi:hypothetical protein